MHRIVLLGMQLVQGGSVFSCHGSDYYYHKHTYLKPPMIDQNRWTNLAQNNNAKNNLSTIQDYLG